MDMLVSMLPASNSFGFFNFPWFIPILIVFVVLGQLNRSRKRARARQRGPQQTPPQPPNVAAFDAGYQPPSADFRSGSGWPNSDQPGPHQPSSDQPSSDQSGSVPAGPVQQHSASNQKTDANRPLSGFASSRWAAEQELKRRLNELDQRRRSGQITAEQYQAEREAIFRNR